MNTLHCLRILILIVSVAALLKGLLMLFWPGMAAKMLRWWVNLPARVLHIIGTLTTAFGLVCIIATALTVNATAAVVLILGTLWIVAGVLYHMPDLLRGLAQPWTAGKPLWFRICGVVAVLIALSLLLLLFYQR